MVATVAIGVVAAASLVAPAAHGDAVEYAGLTCGFTTTHDPTGVVHPDPEVQLGEMDAGPWTAFDLLADDRSGPSAHPGAAFITITCTVQINHATAGGVAAASVSGWGVGVAHVIGQATWTERERDLAYLCTYITMTHGNAVEHYVYDEDGDPSNGLQCSLSVS